MEQELQIEGLEEAADAAETAAVTAAEAAEVIVQRFTMAVEYPVAFTYPYF
jgi:hypothetical protein